MQILRRFTFSVLCLSVLWLTTCRRGVSSEGDSPSPSPSPAGTPKPAPKSPVHHEHHDHSHSHPHEHSHSHGHSHAHTHDHHHGHSHVHSHAHSDAHSHAHAHSHPQQAHFLSGLPIWAKALISVGLISSAPNAVLFLIRVENSAQFAPRLRMMLAFAAGALLGDAFMHLIPHSLHAFSEAAESPESASGSEHSHDTGAGASVGLWVLCGILAFLSVELLVHSLKQLSGSGSGHSHSHSQSHARQDSARSTSTTSHSHTDESTSDGDGPKSPAATSGNSGVRRRNLSKSRRKAAPAPKNAAPASDTNTKNTTESAAKKDADWWRMLKGMRASGWLNLAADFTHNTTDGLAVGAAFLVSDSLGISASLAILLHELPHELADLAILIQAGCSKRTAIMLQLTTAVGAFCGCGVALLLGAGQSESSAASAWVLPFTAGGFIYIAMVTILPELLEPLGPRGGLRSLFFAVLELSLILFGLGAMYLVGLLETHEH